MTNATGFMLRTSIDDKGAMPRSGSWTACPDIIPAGTTAMSTNDLVATYDKVTDKVLTQGLTNYLYVRTKNMNATALTQVVYLFQVDGSLVLQPNLWYTAQHLVGYDVKNPEGDGTPDDPKIIQKYAQKITAEAGAVAVTKAFNWTPDNTNHHCLVAVIADSWKAVLNNYNPGGSMDALAQWIYSNPSMGWHNVNIQPITTTIYESQIAYAHTASVDESITFTMMAENVPVGAKISFSSNSSTAAGTVIGQDWTTVSAPAGGGASNPDFELGTTLTVNAGYTTIITYRTDFNGLTPLKTFKMHMKATKTTTPPASANSASDSLFASYQRAHSPDALFRAADGTEHGRGFEGFCAMLGFTPGDDGDGDDLGDTVVVVIGSHTTVQHES